MLLELQPYKGMCLPKKPDIVGNAAHQCEKAEQAWLHTLRFLWRNYKQHYQELAFALAEKIQLIDSHKGDLHVFWSSEPTTIESFSVAYGWGQIGELEMNVRHEVRSLDPVSF